MLDSTNYVLRKVESCAHTLGFQKESSKRLIRQLQGGIRHGVEFLYDEINGETNFKPCLSLYYCSLTTLVEESGLPIQKSDAIHFYQLNQIAHIDGKTRKLSDYRLENKYNAQSVADIICSDLLKYAPRFFEAQNSVERILSFFEADERAGGQFHDGYLAGLYFLVGDTASCNKLMASRASTTSPIVSKFFFYLKGLMEERL